jgi:hypothetical protein
MLAAVLKVIRAAVRAHIITDGQRPRRKEKECGEQNGQALLKHLVSLSGTRIRDQVSQACVHDKTHEDSKSSTGDTLIRAQPKHININKIILQSLE